MMAKFTILVLCALLKINGAVDLSTTDDLDEFTSTLKTHSNADGHYMLGDNETDTTNSHNWSQDREVTSNGPLKEVRSNLPKISRTKEPDLAWTTKNPINDTSLTTEEEVEIMFTSGSSSGDDYSTQVIISYGCPVNHLLPCVPKCCDVNETHANLATIQANRTECLPRNGSDQFWVDFVDCPDYGPSLGLELNDRYEYFIGIPCTNGKYVLDPSRYPEDVYSVFSNGSLLYANRIFEMTDYCIDTVDGEIKVFVCFDSVPPGEIEFYHILYPVGQIISVLFLLATAATYLGIEQFRDLQGKSLVCHVLCLTVAFAFLATVQLTGSNTDPSFCVVAAFIIQFSFVACFFWLNVLSYDTYRNIRDHLRSVMYSKIHRMEQGEKKTPLSEKRLFILYSIYAWNGPLILLIVSLVLDNVPGIPDTLVKPNFGVRSCWFSSETAALPYFFGPVGLLLAINMVFFSLSAYTVFKEYKATHELSKAQEDEQEVEMGRGKKWRKKMRPYIKALKQCFALFIIMGLAWLAEIVSWAVGGPRYIWVTTDVINTLQGLLIFLVFVYRPIPVRNHVKELLRKWWGVVIHCDSSYQPVHQPKDTNHVPVISDSDGEQRSHQDPLVLRSFHPD